MLLAGYSYAFLSLGMMGWDRLFRVPAWYGLLQPVSVLMFGLIAIYSALRSLLGRGIIWKGRSYGARPAHPETSHERARSKR